MVFLTFFGDPQPLVQKHSPVRRSGIRIRIPLVTLAVLSVTGGLLGVPKWMGGFHPLSDFLHQVLPPVERISTGAGEGVMEVFSALAALAGLGLAYLLVMRRRPRFGRLIRMPVGAALHRFWLVGWGFDWLDNELFIKPFLWLARVSKNDVIDLGPTWLGRLHVGTSSLLQATQTGQLRWYAIAIIAGVVLVLTGVIVL